MGSAGGGEGFAVARGAMVDSVGMDTSEGFRSATNGSGFTHTFFFASFRLFLFLFFFRFLFFVFSAFGADAVFPSRAFPEFVSIANGLEWLYSLLISAFF